MLIAAIMIAGTGISDAVAARGGLMGATSTGYVDVSLTIPPRIQIANNDDINLGLYQNAGDLNGHTDLCIYTNSVGGYKVNVSDDGNNGDDFNLINRSQQNAPTKLPLNVSWNNKKGSSGARKVSQNKAIEFEKMAKSGCAAGDYNANLSVNVSERHLQSAPSGHYTANLAILVEPN